MIRYYISENLQMCQRKNKAFIFNIFLHLVDQQLVSYTFKIHNVFNIIGARVINSFMIT